MQPACPALETWLQLTLLVQSVCLWLALNTLCLDPGTTSPYRDCETPQILSNSSTVTILRPSATLIVIAEPPLWLARNWLLQSYRVIWPLQQWKLFEWELHPAGLQWLQPAPAVTVTTASRQGLLLPHLMVMVQDASLPTHTSCSTTKGIGWLLTTENQGQTTNYCLPTTDSHTNYQLRTTIPTEYSHDCRQMTICYQILSTD